MYCLQFIYNFFLLPQPRPLIQKGGRALPHPQGHDAASSIFSMKMPYPRVGSLTRTWVTAPTSFPS